MAEKKVACSVDPAAEEMIAIAEKENIETSFQRVKTMKACPIGKDSKCCKHCFMGPCRLTKPGAVGICGADIDTVVARNFTRMIAGGTAAHSDHGRDLALTLIAVGEGHTKDFEIKDPVKLRQVAGYLNVDTEDREELAIAVDIGHAAIAHFTNQTGKLPYLSRAPQKRQDIWDREKVNPRGIDREVVESMHRTTMGVDQEPISLTNQAVRTALASGWGGSMLATDITDILFRTPRPITGETNLGVLKENMVNVIVHGHEPTLSMVIAEASTSKEMTAYAKSVGAEGINVAGICCTANEVLMRMGIPAAGNFLHQELAILTGVVEAMVVDVQCVMQALVGLAEKFHTKVITTSPKARITNAMHVNFEEDRAYEIACEILKTACDNFKNRKGEVHIPNHSSKGVVGFSTEYIGYMLGGRYRSSYRPLNDAVIDGRINGIVAIVGCNNPRVPQDEGIITMINSLLANDVLVAVTGCGAIGGGKQGYLSPETAEKAGAGLRSICDTVGIPPVLHLGSCVDNTRILTVLTEMVHEGGLGDDISDIPAVGLCPEWMSEKALEIATYCAASGACVIFGVGNPVAGSEKVTDILAVDWEKRFGGKLIFEPDLDAMLKMTLDHIAEKRAALKLKPYTPGKFGAEKNLLDMKARQKMEDPTAKQKQHPHGQMFS